jgi:hypothetical protein
MTTLLDHPRTPRAVLIAAGVLLVVALIGLASLPTGAATANGTVPDGRRVAAAATVSDVRVMLLSSSRRLGLLVAYEGEKGWHGVEVDPAPRGAVAAWAATTGAGDVPALSAVYGQADGVKVRVRWSDGRTNEVTTESDGTYLIVRPGRVRSDHVTILGEDGAVVTEVEGP